MQIALLRLQDVWLPKIIMSGVIIPATSIAMNVNNKDLASEKGAFLKRGLFMKVHVLELLERLEILEIPENL